MINNLFRSAAIVVVFWPSGIWSMEVSPTRFQIEQALGQAKSLVALQAKDFRTYFKATKKAFDSYHFGEQAICNHGTVHTKIATLMNRYIIEQKKKSILKQEDIHKILNEKSFAVNVSTCQQTNQQGKKNFAIFKQGKRIIKPLNIRQTSVKLENGRVKSDIVATFPYDGINSKGKALLVVIPKSGEVIQFVIDFSSMP